MPHLPAMLKLWKVVRPARQLELHRLILLLIAFSLGSMGFLAYYVSTSPKAKEPLPLPLGDCSSGAAGGPGPVRPPVPPRPPRPPETARTEPVVLVFVESVESHVRAVRLQTIPPPLLGLGSGFFSEPLGPKLLDHLGRCLDPSFQFFANPVTTHTS